VSRRPDVDEMNAHMDVVWNHLFWVIGALAPVFVVTIIGTVLNASWWLLVVLAPFVAFWCYRAGLWVSVVRQQNRLIKAVEAETNRMAAS